MAAEAALPWGRVRPSRQGPPSRRTACRLRELCVKLMFLHPVDYGRKAEELLWRKVYYEVIQLIKTNRKARGGPGSWRAVHLGGGDSWAEEGGPRGRWCGGRGAWSWAGVLRGAQVVPK